MSLQTKIKRKMPSDIRASKHKTPLVCLTAYDVGMAEFIDPECDIILVGDSVGMVVHGLPDTLSVTLEMMILHGKAVMRGSNSALIAIDMPFGCYEKSVEQAFSSASKLITETGCQAVKIEGGSYIANTIEFLVQRGVPVIGHVGLLPQSVRMMGGYKIQGRSKESAKRILEDAKKIEQSGAFALVIEGVKEEVAEQITHAISIPTIGIGASVKCDGQILVLPDMLGMNEQVPKFVKKYANIKHYVKMAVKEYAEDIRQRKFPAKDHIYKKRLKE